MKVPVRTLMLAGLLLATLAAPLWATVQIQELLVRRQGPSVNIRVSMSNPGAERQPGPVLVDLYVRKAAGEPWQLIKHWDDITVVLPGNRIVRDYFDANNALLRDLAASGVFDARTVVTAPGAVAVEQTTSWHDKQR